MDFKKLTNSLWKLQIIGWLIYFVLMFVTYITVNTPETWLEMFFIKLQRTLIGFGLSCILWIIYERILDRKLIGKNVAIMSVLSIVLGVVWTAFQNVYFSFTRANYSLETYLPGQPRVALMFSLTLMAWSAIYLGIKYWERWQTESENALQAKFLAENAQLEMLRYQVNPHFLFNALNSIRASIREDNQPAKDMITQLSEFLRHSLLTSEAKEIPLREELEAVENYLAIEKIRFEETLEVEYDIDEKAKDFKIPCFLLNPLVENAIKHGFPMSPEILKIKISAKLNGDKLHLEVANSGQLDHNANGNGTQIGLNNVRERLEKLFSDKSSFELYEKNGFVVAQIGINK